MEQRHIEKITHSPAHQGFLGKGHLAAAIIDGSRFEETDPFIILMDDKLNLPGGAPVGGAHPHAGFETGTLVLQGNNHEWKTGSFELMTAGKGIVHTEEIAAKTDVHILQLWLALPPEKRWTEPRLQQLLLEDVPTLKNDTNELRVYSGKSNGVSSPLQNHTPFTLVDVSMKRNTIVKQQLPGSYNAFIYVLGGQVFIGNDVVEKGKTAWFNKSSADDSEITFVTIDDDVRFVLYGGEPHHAAIVSHGPFIGDTQEDIVRLYQEYRQKKMPHLNGLPENKKIRHRKTEISKDN